eukprot:COSAG06_NODE_38847_length_419_cov_0.678125_1_plen_99_part_01
MGLEDDTPPPPAAGQAAAAGLAAGRLTQLRQAGDRGTMASWPLAIRLLLVLALTRSDVGTSAAAPAHRKGALTARTTSRSERFVTPCDDNVTLVLPPSM